MKPFFFPSKIDITRPDSEPFVVTIEATVAGYYGDTAIDDVSIFTGFCPSGINSYNTKHRKSYLLLTHLLGVKFFFILF